MADGMAASSRIGSLLGGASSRALTTTHQDEPGIIDAEFSVVQDDAEHKRCIAYYEEAEEAQYEARTKAERDRDYVDNKQLTQEEVDKLERRGQPPIVLNVIRSRAAFLGGLEKKQRRDPKAYPRNNPEDVGAAEAFTQGMRYAVETADYASKRSQVWKNITIEGYGALELAAVQKRDGTYAFTMARIPWDRAFYDKHSAEPDFSDSRYFGQVLWMDYDEALARALQSGHVDEDRAREILDTTLSTAPVAARGRTFDDKPKWQVWGDATRKRVRVVMMWFKDPDGWKYREFTNSGFLASVDGPYVDQDGESYCPWFFESANVDRENNRYGEVRHLIDPQDEVNKRRSKALHQSVSRGVVAEEGAVKDVNATRRELAKPDFYVEILSGAFEKFKIIDGQELTAGQAMLLREAMDYIMQAGPNAALLGKGTEDQSGRAIEAQQAGGLVEQGDLMDTLRRLDWRVFKAIGFMMKQFWDSFMWVRVTDNPEAPEWVGLNEPMWQDPMTGDVAPHSEWEKRAKAGAAFGQLQPVHDPETGEHQRNNDVARLDLDILVSDAPDTITLDGETFQAFTELMKAGLPPPVLKFAIELHPGLPAKRKKQLTDMIDQMIEQQASQQKPPEVVERERIGKEAAEAKIVRDRAAAYKDLTTGEANMAEIGAQATAPPKPEVEEGFQDAPAPAMGPDLPPGPLQGPGAPPAGPGAPMPQQPPHGPSMGQPRPLQGPQPGPGPEMTPMRRLMSGAAA